MVKYPARFVRDKVPRFKNLKEILYFGASKYGDKKCFTYKKNAQVQSISYNGFKKKTESFGAALLDMGLMGKRVAILAETRYEWTLSYHSVVNGNGVVVPLDKEAAPEQLLKFIEISGAEVIFYSNEFKSLVEPYFLGGSNPVLKTAVNYDYNAEEASAAGAGIYSFEALAEAGRAILDGGDEAYKKIEIDNNKMCACLFTSGTTGTSKAVMLSHENLSMVAYGAACCVEIHSKDVIVSVLPIHHTYEFTCTQLGAFALGAEICINDSLRNALKNFKQFKPTKLVLVPLFIETMVKKIWEEIEKKGKTKTVKTALKLSAGLRKAGIDLRRKLFKEIIDGFGGRLEAIVCGGAPLNPEHIAAFDGFGVRIWQGYGITECSPLVSVIPFDMNMKKKNSVGHPIFDETVRIDFQDGEENGEICVKGANVMLGYMGNEEATREVFTEDGFFRTGDIGHLDSDGYLYITGRRKNVIIASNGKNVYPEEIEECLYKCDKIAECVVVGRNKDPGDPASEVYLAAIIYPDFSKYTGTDGSRMPLEDIKADLKKEINAINRGLAAFRRVTELELRETEFERNTSKKIIRYKVK